MTLITFCVHIIDSGIFIMTRTKSEITSVSGLNGINLFHINFSIPKKSTKKPILIAPNIMRFVITEFPLFVYYMVLHLQ
jgi:hypothetical protein